MLHALAYVAGIVAVNWLFALMPPVVLPGGELWPPASLVVGFIFVIRDFAQRALGHKVLFAMLLGACISYFMAGPQIAFASMTAFLVGELFDWGVYSFTGRPFSQRVMLSSIVSVPLDTVVFLACINMLGAGSVLIMTVSKLAGAFIVFCLVRRRERFATAG